MPCLLASLEEQCDKIFYSYFHQSTTFTGEVAERECDKIAPSPLSRPCDKIAPSPLSHAQIKKPQQ